MAAAATVAAGTPTATATAGRAPAALGRPRADCKASSDDGRLGGVIIAAAEEAGLAKRASATERLAEDWREREREKERERESERERSEEEKLLSAAFFSSRKISQLWSCAILGGHKASQDSALTRLSELSKFRYPVS